MKKKLLLIVLSFILIVGIVACSNPAPSTTATTATTAVTPIKWRAWSPEGVGENGYDFVEKVAAEITATSGGRLIVTPDSSDSLGFVSEDILKVMKQNGVELAHFFRAVVGGDVPYALACSQPFMASSLEDVKTLVTTLNPMWDAELPKWNAKMLASWSAAPTVLAAPRKVVTVEGWKGLKIRAWSEVLSRSDELLGATPVNIPYAEAYTATVQGIIDSHTWSPQGCFDNKVYELMHYINLWYTTFSDDGFIVNTTAYNKLPPDLQKVVLDAVAKYQDYVWQTALFSAQDSLDELALKGMEIVPVPQSEVIRCVTVLAPIYDAYVKNTGPEGLAWLNKCLAAVGKPAYGAK